MIAFDAIRRVHRDHAYANLVLKEALAHYQGSHAGFITELVNGTCRMQGSYDRIIESAAGRKLASLQPALIDVLRLGAHQLFSMDAIPDRAAVSATVNLGAVRIGERVTGLVNAIMRALAARSWDEWIDQLSEGVSDYERVALAYGHPLWIVEHLAMALSDDSELEECLAANNAPAEVMLAVRPGLASVDDLIGHGCIRARYSPWGVSMSGNPASIDHVVRGTAGVQDEGSQMVTLAAIRAATAGSWLDLCAGPGGKSALLAGCAPGLFVANEVASHRAGLVHENLRAYDDADIQIICGDGRKPGFKPESFSLVVADVPCSGLGALRRRAESRWARNPSDIAQLNQLQAELLEQAYRLVAPGGVVAYITCSPELSETVHTVHRFCDAHAEANLLDAPSLIEEVPMAASYQDPRCIQLWPHRHHTDAMFCALIKRSKR